MMTKRDFIRMAKWISENTSSDSEWAHIRASHIRFVCHIAEEAEKTQGNRKVFEKELFLRAIVHFDKEGKTENEPS